MIKLPRLFYGWQNQPTVVERYWDQAMTSIENNINDILAIPAIAAAVAAATAAAAAANSAATAASSAAATAQTAADGAASTAQLANSGVSGAAITATDAGSNATVFITSHDRVYSDGTTVAVTGGSITGLSYSTLYFIYYDQASRAGGAVTYQATTVEANAAQTGDRHLVGSITTPAAAAPGTGGNYVRPPGVGGI